MIKRYKGAERRILRIKVEQLRSKGMNYTNIGLQLNISPTFASTLFRESQAPVKLSIMDRLKLWLTFKM